MERLLEVSTLKEIFRGDNFVGGLQEFADRVRQLHHRFLTMQLASQQEGLQVSIEELLRFAEDAEFLATEYTNPLVIERNAGLPIEDIPNRQIVQDALALAGTIFEYLGDTLALYEQQNSQSLEPKLFTATGSYNESGFEESELYRRLGRSDLLYLKSALCYGLGLYESRTQVILKRILDKLRVPNQQLTLLNRQIWADYLVCALLGRKLRQILHAEQLIGEQISVIRSRLRRSMESESFSLREVANIETSLSLIEASVLSAKAFLQGDLDLLERALESLTKAINSVHQLGNYELEWILRTSRKVLMRMWADSPWERLSKIIPRRTYLSKLVEDGIVTLWSSQIAALEVRSKLGVLTGGYLDDRIKRVVINMPTSAGKTLLAELAIAHLSFSTYRNKCIYVGPSRALCDQVAADLASRLARFGVRVTALVSDNELIDDTYESILFRKSNVIVVTPEKLSYLFRQKNSFVQDSKLFIFDELHSISKADRGWIYEEIISLVLRHPRTTDAKMMFLSAVMPNHLTVQEWVDPDRLGDTISELWQPTRTLKGAITFSYPLKRPNLQQREVLLPGDLIYVRHKEDLSSPLRINNFIQSKQVCKEKAGQHWWERDSELSDNEINHAVAAAVRFARLGPVLVYCPKKVDTAYFCKLAQELDLTFLSWRDGEKDHYQEIIEFIRERLSIEHPLVDALNNRIAFHHGGLPSDVRNEIEYAFRKGWIHILAATSTLVEGVNFPVKTLLLTDYCQRYWNPKQRVWSKIYPLNKSDFKNITGRAGRALYETEGQVVLIQSITGYPYNPIDRGFEDYLTIESDSSELNINSTLADDSILADLGRLVEEVDNGILSEDQLLFKIQAVRDNRDIIKIVDKLHVFALLLKDQELVGDDEESFVRIFQGTFLGKQLPDIAPQTVGTFSNRSARAIKSLVNPIEQALFAQTGLKISTCRKLMDRVRSYWEKKGENFDNFLTGSFDEDVLYEIAKVIYDLGDEDTDPQEVKEKPNGRTKKRIDDSAFFVDWILYGSDWSYKYFLFIKDISWRAQEYIDYTRNTLEYKTPWTLSAFWIFSKAIVSTEFGVDLISTRLGRELILLPAYAKFGVNTPAAALFSTLGVNPSQLARQIGDLYEKEHNGSEDKYNYLKMLQWLLSIEPIDLEKSNIKPSFIRRLTRLLSSLKPLNDENPVQESEKMWEVDFPIAGWQYYEGESNLQNLRIGETLVLRPEPANRYDPNAIEIITESGVKLGYVPRYKASDVIDQISIRPVKATISNIHPSAPMHEKVFLHCLARW